MEQTPGIEPGCFLSGWYEDSDGITFDFERGLHMCFNEEADAIRLLASFVTRRR
jgi:hypothetical protein